MIALAPATLATRCQCLACCAVRGGALSPDFAIDSPTQKNFLGADNAAEALTRTGTTWSGGLGTPITVTYGFRSTISSTYPSDPPDDLTNTFVRFTASQIAGAEAALQLWSDVANITFSRVGSGTSGAGAYTDNASILFSSFDSADVDASFAFAYFPGSTSAINVAGDIWTNIESGTNLDMSRGGYGFTTLLHEIGHAIGLSHPGDYDASAGTFTYNAAAEFYEDSHRYSVMSYFLETNTAASFGPIYPLTPMLYDIAAAQRLYGANTSTRSGSTVYGFNSTAGRSAFSLTSASDDAAFAIWDGGGIDTLDLSGYSGQQTINLAEGGFSSAGGNANNIAIAFGALIENALGGTGRDVIFGNDAVNDVSGGAGSDVFRLFGGNDIARGGSGRNQANFSGSIFDYELSRVSSFTYVDDQVAGRDGRDALNSVRFLVFTDATVNMGQWGDIRPMAVALTDAPITDTNDTEAVSDWFAIANPDGGPGVSSVRVRFDPTSGSAHGVLRNGATVLASGTWHTLTLAQFNALTYEGSSVGSDVFQVQASDSTGLGAIDSATVQIAAPAVPVVSALRYVAEQTSGTDIPIGEIFSDRDPGGDAITQYRVQITGSGGGQLRVNGSPLTSGVLTTLTPSQYEDLVYRAGSSGSNTLTVQAIDDDGNSSFRNWTMVNGDFAASTSTVVTLNVDDFGLGVVGTAGDEDWFKVTLTAGRTYQIDLVGYLYGYTLDDPLVRLLNASGGELTQNDDGGLDRNARITFTATTTGSHFIGARAFSDETGSYRVSVVDVTSGGPFSAPQPGDAAVAFLPGAAPSVVSPQTQAVVDPSLWAASIDMSVFDVFRDRRDPGAAIGAFAGGLGLGGAIDLVRRGLLLQPH